MAGIVGFGAFLLLRAMSVVPPPHKTEGTSRHKAAATIKYGENAGVLKVLPNHMGKFGTDSCACIFTH